VVFRFLWWFFGVLCLAGCAKGSARMEAAESPAVIPAARADPGGYAETQRERAFNLAFSLDDRSLAAQVLMAGVDGNGRPSEPMRALLETIPVGALVFFKHNLDTEPERIAPFIGECVRLVLAAAGAGEGIPPFTAVDHEGGRIHRFGPGVQRLPPAASFWDLAQREGRNSALAALAESAFRSGTELRGLGITMNLAPVAEVLNGENRSFLGDRSYGPDADFVEAAAAAFIQGMERAGIACVVKHFPGNSAADPHRERTVLTGDRESLSALVRPFAGLVRRVKVPALMVCHALVPAWDAERAASLSPSVIRDRIRGDLAFTGILLADDFSMGAAGSAGAPAVAVEAINAGVDMIMVWPADLAAVHRALLSALGEGRVSRERLQAAAAGILLEKIRRGMVQG
jgi:beta-N-acetylhexosaminidase